jgi:hypothetical protein
MVLEQHDEHGVEVGIFEGFGKVDKDVDPAHGQHGGANDW